uniref:Uncharacterized protein n=1 Tax=Anopheles maculatus TaxID=74869 RepID=A0A182SII7_9DIPT
GQGNEEAEPNLPNGDVTEPDGDKPTRTADPLAKTRTNDGDGGLTPNACAPQLTVGTNTSAPPHIVDNVTAERQLLNIKNGSPTTTTYSDRHEHNESAGDQSTTTPVGEDRALGSSEETILTGSSKPAANLTVSESNAAEPTVNEPEQQQPPTIQEMGQQPSRAGTEQRSQTIARSKSSSPPHPPPRNQRSVSVLPVLDREPAAHLNTTVVTIVQDAAGDDTSDDRDVFYEATETIVPGSPNTQDERRADTSATGTPEPIRASLVLKLAEPDHRNQRESPQKKQVSFKLTQNGSDDVEVTSVDSSDVDSDSEERQPALQTSDTTTRTYSGNRCTAFSESNNPPPPPYGVSAFGCETGNNYIEFQYDHSAVSGDAKPVADGAVEKCAVKEQTAGVLIEDSVASLPDVVQPSNIEPTTFSTVEKINSEMKDLVNQESRYSAKLEEAEKRVKEANVKVYELQQKLDAVERDALLKEYNVERKF